MKAAELDKKTLSGNIFYIEGDDSYWKAYAEKFFESLVPDEDRAFDLKIIEKLTSYNDIEEAVNTFSMTGGRIVTIVKDETYKEQATEKDVLKKLFPLVGDNVLVFSSVQFLSTATKKSAVFVDASRADAYTLNKIITSRFPAKGIEPRAVDMLIEYTSRDMARIENEITKLLAYGGNVITAADVDALVQNTVENQVYELSGALAVGNKRQAMEILAKFEARGVQYAYLLGALVGQYRRMLHGALSKSSDAELAKQLGVKEFAIKKARDTARKYKKTQLKAALDLLVDAEYSFKSGVTSEETAFKTAIAKLISE